VTLLLVNLILDPILHKEVACAAAAAAAAETMYLLLLLLLLLLRSTNFNSFSKL
jgi:hypothetical protein